MEWLCSFPQRRRQLCGVECLAAVALFASMCRSLASHAANAPLALAFPLAAPIVTSSSTAHLRLFIYIWTFFCVDTPTSVHSNGFIFRCSLTVCGASLACDLSYAVGTGGELALCMFEFGLDCFVFAGSTPPRQPTVAKRVHLLRVPTSCSMGSYLGSTRE